MDIESERMWTWPHLRYYSSICQEGLSKTTKASVNIAGLRTEI
jgi:hypothetical protein